MEQKVTLEMVQEVKGKIMIGDFAICNIPRNENDDGKRQKKYRIISKSKYFFNIEHIGKKGNWQESIQYIDIITGEVKLAERRPSYV